jgi:hypothetical protein
VVVKGIEKATDKVIVAKLLELRPETEAKVTREFEALRSFRHERIATLLAAYKPTGKGNEWSCYGIDLLILYLQYPQDFYYRPRKNLC